MIIKKDCDLQAHSRTIYFFKIHIFAYLIVVLYAICHHNSVDVNSLKSKDYRENSWLFKKENIQYFWSSWLSITKVVKRFHTLVAFEISTIFIKISLSLYSEYQIYINVINWNSLLQKQFAAIRGHSQSALLQEIACNPTGAIHFFL